LTFPRLGTRVAPDRPSPGRPRPRARADKREISPALLLGADDETALTRALTDRPVPSAPAQAPSGVQDPYATQGNYGYPAAPNPAPPNPDYGAPLIPGFGAPPAVSAEYPTQAPAYGRADPSYGGAAVTYDAVNYPSIPDLIAHSQRHSSVSAPPSSGYGYGGAAAGGGTAGGSSNARVGGKPREMAGAPRGSNRYRCMLFPTCDGGDIESVVCQVGLDGIALFEEDGDRVGDRIGGHGYELDKISSWRLADPTILTVKVAGRDGVSALSLSADEATCGAMMDTLVTSAFQWCELRGHDASGTIEDKNGEWFNNKVRTRLGPGVAWPPDVACHFSSTTRELSSTDALTTN